MKQFFVIIMWAIVALACIALTFFFEWELSNFWIVWLAAVIAFVGFVRSYQHRNYIIELQMEDIQNQFSDLHIEITKLEWEIGKLEANKLDKAE